MNRARTTLAMCGFGAAACSMPDDVVFVPLVIEFSEASSATTEDTEQTHIGVRLSHPSAQRVTFRIGARDVTASGHDACGSRDYSIPTDEASFEPGETETTVVLRQLNDDLSEIDERVDLTLQDSEGALIGPRSAHRHTILDDDRSTLLDVKADFGALGDGSSDDTARVQQAIERAAVSSGSVVYFPEGTYVLGTIDLSPELNLFGQNAVITRAAGQPPDQKAFILRYDGEEDSHPTLVQGFVFDGNRDEQPGPYTAWEYRHADLLDVAGSPATPGRLRLIVENVTFRNTGSSGLQIGPNADVTACALRGDEVFTDVVHVRGGHSRVRVTGLIAEGLTGTAGIAVNATDAGYEGDLSVEVELSDVQLRSGDFQAQLAEGSSLVGTRVEVERAPLLIRAPNARVHFEDCLFTIGPSVFDFNRIVAPTDVTFSNTRFVLTEKPELLTFLPEASRELRALDVVWNDVALPYDDTEEAEVISVIDDQLLTLRDCSFELASDVEPSDETFAVGTTDFASNDPALAVSGGNNRVVVIAPELGSGFDGLFAPECSGCSTTP